MTSHESPDKSYHTHDEDLRDFDFTPELAEVAARATFLDLAPTNDVEGAQVYLASE